MAIQKTDWGQIDWIRSQEDGDTNQSFNIGITSILPGKRLLKHIHYGHEQFLYILDGEGIYIINGKKIKFKKGMYFYVEADSCHETINIGTTPVRELLITNPINYNSEIHMYNNIIKNIDDETNLNTHNILYSSVEAIRTQLLESISFPFTIYDDMWSIVIQSKNFSDYCIEKCNPIGNSGKCDCMIKRNFDKLNNFEVTQFMCKYGLTMFYFPIIYENKYLGAVIGGNILVSDFTIENHDELYDSPKSTIIGIISLLRQIVKSILSFCAFNESRQLLQEKEKTIHETIRSKKMLEKSLHVVNDKVTNLKINHHFLFNTLNSLASMAIDGDREDLYNAIIDLSKMFRYTMTVDLRFVPLISEIEYLETYLNLQRLRYGKGLEVEYEIDKEMQNISVPFNFLQPIVENAFTHGFSSYDDKKIIIIKVKKINNRAMISILNNGVSPDTVTLNRVNKSLAGNTGHGLSLIYQKLKSAYDLDFKMNIVLTKEKETCVKIDIPINFYKEHSCNK